jgi:hypothetical protein
MRPALAGMANLMQPARADPISALLVLLDLLEGDAEGIAQRRLTHVQHHSAHAHATADVPGLGDLLRTTCLLQGSTITPHHTRRAMSFVGCDQHRNRPLGKRLDPSPPSPSSIKRRSEVAWRYSSFRAPAFELISSRWKVNNVRMVHLPLGSCTPFMGSPTPHGVPLLYFASGQQRRRRVLSDRDRPLYPL